MDHETLASALIRQYAIRTVDPAYRQATPNLHCTDLARLSYPRLHPPYRLAVTAPLDPIHIDVTVRIATAQTEPERLSYPLQVSPAHADYPRHSCPCHHRPTTRVIPPLPTPRRLPPTAHPETSRQAHPSRSDSAHHRPTDQSPSRRASRRASPFRRSPPRSTRHFSPRQLNPTYLPITPHAIPTFQDNPPQDPPTHRHRSTRTNRQPVMMDLCPNKTRRSKS